MGGRIVDMEMKKMEEDGKTMNNETSVRITEYLIKDVKAPTKSITVPPNKYFLELNNYFCSVLINRMTFIATIIKYFQYYIAMGFGMDRRNLKMMDVTACYIKQSNEKFISISFL